MHAISSLPQRNFDPGLPSAQFLEQWKYPADVFSVLLILGGDVVVRALAQLVGSRVTPDLIPVSLLALGWVAYAVTAVVDAVGENKLMLVADCSCKIINGSNGFVRDNYSWIIGRIDKSKADAKKKTREPGATPQQPPGRPLKAGLCVSIYRAKEARPGYSGYDRPYIVGFITCIIQLGLAAIPYRIFGDRSILLITEAGIALSFVSGALPQWSQEKWACRRDTRKTVVLTRGNGSQHAIMIIGDGKGLDLEDLAAADVSSFPSGKTTFAVITLAALWILLLITVSRTQRNTWFLLAIGSVGILQNIYVAGASRSPKAFGVPVEFVEVIGETKVMPTLFRVEEHYPRLGKNMLGTFFPGDLREDEQVKWAEYETIAKTKGKGGF
ncbi:MAG: hypothetical protein M1834_004892 [Cirrosporium novae-zelandiae]|nr:MAG: hypothetical protein M1834_004892 [Cirrosporium novae-zelandiae]